MRTTLKSSSLLLELLVNDSVMFDIAFLKMTESQSSSVSFRYEDFLVDVGEILKERSERYRIGDTIFEDVLVKEGDGEISPVANTEVGGILRLVESTQSIKFKRVGVGVFDLSCAGKIFDEAKLHSNLCESKPANMINHPLFHISKADLNELIQRGLLKQKMKKQIIYNHINKYLFFLMSCHYSDILANACCDTLIYHLLTSSGKTNSSIRPWRPSIDDIMLVFCNYGASKDLLASWETQLPQRVLPYELTENPPPILQLKNILLVLRLISSLLVHHKITCYTMTELDHLLCIVLTVSLDKHIVQIQSVNMHIEFSKCIKSILAAYPTHKWQKSGKVSNLSRALHNKLKNVHISDVYFVINNYILCPGFGQKLALSLIHAFIKGTVLSNKAVTHLDNVEVKHISKIFRVDSLVEIDHYTQYYILLMVDKIVTNLIFTSDDMWLLDKTRQMLSNLRIKSPHSEDMVDYLLVKELITRAATTWKLSVSEVT